MNRYLRCAAPGCLQVPRKFSRYCHHHASRLERCRDLKGSILTLGELRPHRAECTALIERLHDHPAIQGGLEYMAELIAPSDRAGFLRSEFDRLRIGGATPEAMLASVLAVYSWTYCAGQQRHFGQRCFRLNLGRALLGTIPGRRQVSRTGKSYSVRIPPGHAEALGENLEQALGKLATACVLKIVRDSARHAPDERGRLIREALEAAPLDDAEGGKPSENSEPTESE